MQRRATDAGIKTKIGNHTFRATSITAYLKNNGTLEWRSTSLTTTSPERPSSTTGGRRRFRSMKLGGSRSEQFERVSVARPSNFQKVPLNGLAAVKTCRFLLR